MVSESRSVVQHECIVSNFLFVVWFKFFSVVWRVTGWCWQVGLRLLTVTFAGQHGGGTEICFGAVDWPACC